MWRLDPGHGCHRAPVLALGHRTRREGDSGNREGSSAGFRFHDLRHYFASLLIAAGLDVKVVQTRLRHASAVTTLNTYGHMFPDKDESARAAVAAALAARADSVRTQGVVTAL